VEGDFDQVQALNTSAFACPPPIPNLMSTTASSATPHASNSDGVLATTVGKSNGTITPKRHAPSDDRHALLHSLPLPPPFDLCIEDISIGVPPPQHLSSIACPNTSYPASSSVPTGMTTPTKPSSATCLHPVGAESSLLCVFFLPSCPPLYD
jgi:hypothetical protein